MTTPISITTKQTGDLHRKWNKANKTNRALLMVASILWALSAILRVIGGISNPDWMDWMEWVNVGLAATAAILLFLSAQFPHLLFPTMTTTVTFTDQNVSISMDKKGKTSDYSVEWRKVYVHESSDCYFFQVNWHQMQIFRKEDLTDCTPEELSAFFAEKLGKRYVKL